MRDIRFRAWDGKVNWMSESFYLGSIHSGDGFNSSWDLMQYTGLNDKNGKEIYEGDIVRGKVDYQGQAVEITAPVEWMTSAAMFMVHDIYRINQTGFGLCAIGKIKVIGNIYENPELIK